MKKLITAMAVAASMAVIADIANFGFKTGIATPSPYGGKLVAARVLSSVASGTATVKVLVQSDLVYDTTNVAHIVATNTLTSSATCTNGYAAPAPSGTPYILPGDRLFLDGTASGTVIIAIER